MSQPADVHTQLTELTSRLEGAIARLDDLETHNLDAATADPVGEERPAYASLRLWVEEYFVHHFPRRENGTGVRWRWCSQWWDHVEAVSRLTGLWHSWEMMHRQPGNGLATWYTTYLDPQLPVLLGGDGPFANCTVGGHHREPKHDRPDPLAVVPPPPEDLVKAGEPTFHQARSA